MAQFAQFNLQLADAARLLGDDEVAGIDFFHVLPLRVGRVDGRGVGGVVNVPVAAVRLGRHGIETATLRRVPASVG